MENKATSQENIHGDNKTAAIRTLKDDIAKATLAKKSGEVPPEPFGIHMPLPQKKEEEKIEKKPEITPDNPFIRSDLLPFKDGELPENPKKTQFEISPLRTYTNDVAEVVKTGNTSVIQIAVAEQKEKNEKIEKTDTGRFRKNLFMIVGSLICVALGVGIFYYGASSLFPKKVIVVTTKNTALIVTENEKEIILSKDQKKFLEELKKALEVAPSASTIQSIKVIDEISGEKIPSVEFLSVVAKNIPPTLLRSFHDEFLLGVYSNNQQPIPFVILKIDSFANAFAGMLKWERNMKSDIGELFIDKVDQEKPFSTELNTSENYKDFKDSVIKNQDARVLTNEQGKIILLYSFINKDILIITRDGNTLNVLVQRLRNAQILR